MENPHGLPQTRASREGEYYMERGTIETGKISLPPYTEIHAFTVCNAQSFRRCDPQLPEFVVFAL